MAKIDLDKFICSLLDIALHYDYQLGTDDIKLALRDQGLEYKDGKIIEQQRMVSAKAKEALYGKLTEFEQEFDRIAADYMTCSDCSLELIKDKAAELLSIARKQIAAEIDVDTMVEDHISIFGINSSSDYRKGIQDTLNAIKEK